MKVITTIKEWLTRKWEWIQAWSEKRAERKEREQREELIKEVRNSYAVDVRNSIMWIVCGSNSVYGAEAGETVESVINRMNRLIETNLKYKGLSDGKVVQHEGANAEGKTE